MSFGRIRFPQLRLHYIEEARRTQVRTFLLHSNRSVTFAKRCGFRKYFFEIFMCFFEPEIICSCKFQNSVLKFECNIKK